MNSEPLEQLNNMKLRVEMPDGSWWDIPVTVIVNNRWRYYANKESIDEKSMLYQKVFIEESLVLLNDHEEIIDWAENNMNWSDVKEFAVMFRPPSVNNDYNAGWSEGMKEVIENDEKSESASMR